MPKRKYSKFKKESNKVYYTEAKNNLEGVLSMVVEEMGGEETASELVPGARWQAGRRDDGPVVATYLPQGKNWVL